MALAPPLLPPSFDCIVIGLGGFGSATLLRLARRGARVLGLEQFGPAHDRGSSHGETRVIRKAYFEHPDYVPLLNRAYQLWGDLEQATSQQLFVRSGLILSARPECEAVAGTLDVAATHGLDIQQLPLTDARQQFPTFRFADDEVVVYERDAGYLYVEECIRANLKCAQEAGAVTRFDEPVRSIEIAANSVRVRTEQGAYTAAKLIVAGGAWSGRLLAELDLPLQVLRKVLFWHPIAPESAALQQHAPCFLFQDDAGVFYGFPCIDGRTVKMAEHSAGKPIDNPDTIDRSLQGDDAAPVEAFIGRHLPLVSRPAERHGVCMYTMTPDAHFIVDRHPHHQNVVIGAGFSGHGFKFTPAIGEALAELALDGQTRLPIEFLSISRPAIRDAQSASIGN